MAASRRAAIASPSDEQLHAILAPEGPLLILAGPGSGKTNTLADRIGYLVRVCRVPPQRVLAFSFTRVAAATLRDRLALRLGRDAAAVAVTTFHSFGRRIIERWAVDLGYDGPRLRVLSREDARSLLEEAFGALVGEPPPDLALETIEESVFRVRLGEAPGAAESLALALAEAYEGALRERRALDYTAMLALPLRLFAHRPEILRRYRDAYRHILVDEYQDVNLAQYRLARLLAGGHDCLAVVGDPAQTIYAFAGASARFLLDFPREYPGATVAALTRNYRSTGHIVEATNVVALPLPYGRPLWTANDAGPPLVLRAADDPADEAAYVAAEIRSLLDRRLVAGPAEIAVLSRNNDQFPAIARALAARDIPHGDRRATGDRVRLATIHAAKGDEWPAVFVTGLEEGLLPDRRAVAGDEEALVAERHLAYVAVSRPRVRLYLTYCARRTLSGDGAVAAVHAVPSRFLVAIPAAVATRAASGKEAA